MQRAECRVWQYVECFEIENECMPYSLPSLVEGLAYQKAVWEHEGKRFRALVERGVQVKSIG